MIQERKLTFGKYKGKDIKYIILTHIGYIMWCFENISWFKLTDEEQALYDAIAIMYKKENVSMTFPVELMYKHIKNREAFGRLETPFFINSEFIAYYMSEKDNPICKSIEKYITSTQQYREHNLSIGDLYALNHSMNKEIERAYCNGESDEEVYGGWGSMNDYR